MATQRHNGQTTGGGGMTGVDDWIQRLQNRNPGFWDTLTHEQRQRFRNLAESYLTGGKTYADFFTELQTRTPYQTWSTAQTGTTPPPADDGGTGGDTGDTPEDTGAPLPEDTGAQQSLLARITQLLQQWNLPTSLTSFIQDEIVSAKSYDEIINDLRSTPEYQTAFPENKMRLDNGFSPWSEAQILEYRDQARQTAQSLLGISNVTNDEIANLIAHNKSLDEWQTDLQTYKTYERWGPYVKQALSQELGYNVDDARAYAFMHPDMPTPELDLAYEKALLRGQPASLGFGIRPEDEANLLIQFGIDPQKAFQGYQGIAQELPAATRARLLANHLNENAAHFPTTADALPNTPFSDLFNAIQLGDVDSLQRLRNDMALGVASFQGNGGIRQAQSGASAGLLGQREE